MTGLVLLLPRWVVAAGASRRTLLLGRVPERPAEQSVEQFWSTPEVGMKVLPVWFLLEGAGTLASVGYFLTGEPVAAVAAGVLIAAFWWCGPNVFAKE